ncbi:dipeptidase [Corynebacterium breve]|uniref:Dipeptidase n=1 Tax=Corynebacterium breve TaxID=3049799 RepID=A0ABY8VFH8_9CORY|nr:dipeptidase [Corynebacterium breve]WIM67388.1 dipeptidase [Corynebacterium breve]
MKPQRERIFTDLAEIVSFNSVHSVPELVDEHQAAADWVVDKLSDAGLDVEAIDTIDGTRTIIGRKAPVGHAPVVLLYSHYDVVPAGDPALWTDDPFTLTERDGRWYGRGTADCKGNLVMHLEVLRLLEEYDGTDCGLIVLVEGSEEMGGEGLDHLIKTRPELFEADAILIADSGNAAVGVPTLTTMLRGGARVSVTVDTLEAGVHSGQFGGAAPDAVAALVRIMDSLRDEHGRTTIDGVDCLGTWDGEPYERAAFRTDAGVLEGVQLMGTIDDEPADMVWSRPAVNFIGFTSTPVAEAINAVPATATALLNLRVPPGMNSEEVASLLVAHIESHAPWGVKVTVDADDINPPFATDASKPAVKLLGECLVEAYGATSLATVGSGGSIPLTSALQEAYPDAEIALFGVEEPQCTIHSPDESVDPSEIEHIAVAEALFLQRYGKDQ